mmetsp:Transcript_17659/g.29839  ORF Transcript_17659/g.29839 Transcript_17659/m.29839 type:complete len:255 (-) Transcript_17659:63-827(-)
MPVDNEGLVHIPPHAATRIAQLAMVEVGVADFEHSARLPFPHRRILAVISNGVLVDDTLRALSLLEVDAKVPGSHPLPSEPHHFTLRLVHLYRPCTLLPEAELGRVSVYPHVLPLLQGEVNGEIDGVAIELVAQHELPLALCLVRQESQVSYTIEALLPALRTAVVQHHILVLKDGLVVLKLEAVNHPNVPLGPPHLGLELLPVAQLLGATDHAETLAQLSLVPNLEGHPEPLVGVNGSIASLALLPALLGLIG